MSDDLIWKAENGVASGLPEPPYDMGSNVCVKQDYAGDKECPWCRIEALELELSEMIKGWQEYQAGLGDE